MYVVFGSATCFYDGCGRADAVHFVTLDAESTVVQEYAKCLCEKFEY